METPEPTHQDNQENWLDRPLLGGVTLKWSVIIFIVVVLIALVSRTAMLGSRVMSHDETSHVYFSWILDQGRGYSHDPVTHGPLQFHLIAFSYFLFGDSDFSARLPVAIASILSVVFLWNYRRYLGKVGWLVAAVLMVISPYMLYYGRYARNEALVVLFGLVSIWAVLRYLETGSLRYLFWLTAATALHFTTKETAYIYTAQLMIFLGIYFLARVYQSSWTRPEYRNRFMIAVLLALVAVGFAAGFMLIVGDEIPVVEVETAAPALPGDTPEISGTSVPTPVILVAGIGVISFLVALFFLVRGYGLTNLRDEKSFGLLILLATLILPMLAPFPVKLLGWDPLDYTSQGMWRTAIFMIPLTIIAILVGLWWNARTWLLNAALFYGIYVVFYTTLFTNGTGFFTGMVGSLGYWLAQQAVERGNQPWYYYAALQIPIYEYLTAIGSLLALGLATFGRNVFPENPEPADEGEEQKPNPQRLAVTLFGFWAITSLLAYTYAGEKMPWLTVHIALPMILLSGWAFGYLIESITWSNLRARRGVLVVILIVVFIFSLAGLLGSILGPNPPFQGKELEQLQASSTFMLALLVTVASGAGLVYLLRSWSFGQIARLSGLIVLGLLAFLTARTAYTTSFVNYDFANEYLVYAHAGQGPKQIMDQIDEISRRTTNGNGLAVAYDNKSTYPFWWYLRNYPNTNYFATNPTRDLRDSPIIIVGSENYGKIEPIVGQAFDSFEYTRMWWPNQDYYNLTWERIRNAITNPAMRSALFQIWLNRDFTEYGEVVGRDMSLPNWQPAEVMRMYIRKDITSQIWNYGVGPSTEDIVADPYEGKETLLNADTVFGTSGIEPGQFQRPRGVAAATDGTLYVADTDNHRIQHLDRNGTPLNAWGTFADLALGPAPGGTFYEPWGIAVGPDGSVYVADTWNHRIQKFSPEGEFLTMWGYFGQAEQLDGFWGPRDVVVDADGRVIVSDTGNKRIVIFGPDGEGIAEFGEEGYEPGQFYEPVGLALDAEGILYVADTWNQRIQSFDPDGSGSYMPSSLWDIYGWYGQSLDNKPFLAADDQIHIFAGDPEGVRVLEFNNQGDIVRYWGDYSVGSDGFALVGGIAIDPAGGVWVADTGNSRIMHFNLP
ncbi:MAG: TIGR03663 family protein [Anaerolineales bacterium]|nr:TIGR03663 family protein [Anaerolineales bacterium]